MKCMKHKQNYSWDKVSQAKKLTKIYLRRSIEEASVKFLWKQNQHNQTFD